MVRHGAWQRGISGTKAASLTPLRRFVTLGRVIVLFRPYRVQIALILLTIVLGAVLGVVPPLLTRAILADLLGQHDARLLTGLFVATVAVAVLSSLLNMLQTYLNTLIGQNVMADLRRDLYAHLQKLSLRWYTSTRIGDIMSRFNNDIGGIQGVVTGAFVNISTNALTLIVTMAVMAALNWQLSILALITISLFVVPTRRVGGVRKRLSRFTQQSLSDMSVFLQETLSINGVILVKAFAQERREAKRFQRLSHDIRQLQIRQSLAGRWFFMCVLLVGTLGPALIYWLGALQVLHLLPGPHDIPTIVAFVELLGRLYSPAAMLMNIWVDLQTAAALFDRIFEYLDVPVEISSNPGAPILNSMRRGIRFEHVSFGYVRGRLALDNVSFEIEPGQLAALVGPSGAGKTTITYLVPRFYDPDAGHIIIDGHDLRTLDLRSIGEHIGMVTQETFLFHTTIRENIAYGRPEATDEEIEVAARAANIHEFIDGLPDGYDTVVGERGYKLSGGEKQRVAIARVILKDPHILILDEATSSLDSQSEVLVQAALDPLMRRCTSLVIAHRLSTILSADVILVMSAGCLVERGTHADLLKRGGLYATLYHTQFKAEAQRLGAVRRNSPSARFPQGSELD